MIKSLLFLMSAISTGLVVNNVARNDVVLTNNDVTKWNNYVNSLESYDGSSYDFWDLYEQDFDEDFPFRSCFDVNGNLNVGGNYDLSAGFYYYSTTSGGVTTTNDNLKFIPQLKTMYIVVSFNSNSNLQVCSSNYLRIDVENNFQFQSTDHSELDIYSNTQTGFKIGSRIYQNGVQVYQILWDTDFQYFVNKYGLCWYDKTHSLGLNYDGGFDAYATFQNLDMNVKVSVYTEDTLRFIQSVGNNYNQGYNNGYNTGYSKGSSDTITNDYQGQSYNDIYNNGYSNGLTVGYNSGVASVSDSSAVVNGLFSSIANVPVVILNACFTPTIFNIPIVSILLSFLAILLILWLCKRLIK